MTEPRTNIRAESFMQAWLSACNGALAPEIEQTWWKAKAFTSLMRREQGPLHRVAQQLGLRFYGADYYGTDCVMYREEDLVAASQPGQTWLSGLAVAVEHENDARSGLFHEAAHLLLLQTELRVLISYPGKAPADPLLAEAGAVIAGSRLAQTVAQDRSFLFILGEWEPVRWTGYVFNPSAGGSWERLNHAPESTG